MSAPPAPPPDALRLLAQDEDDLRVISAALQDAVVKRADISWEKQARRLTIALNRFRWESGGERVRSALQFGGVLAVKARGMPRRQAAVLELLALEFEPGEAPGGAVLLMFAAGADLRVEVECVDAVLVDLSAPWPARRAPSHEL